MILALSRELSAGAGRPSGLRRLLAPLVSYDRIFGIFVAHPAPGPFSGKAPLADTIAFEAPDMMQPNPVLGRRGFFGAAVSAAAPAFALPAPDKTAIIRKVEAIPARIPYRDTFVIGRGLVAAGGQAGQYVYVRVETGDGVVGWGETIALPSWSYETVESITSTVRKYLAPIVTGRSAFDQAYFERQFDETLTPAVSQGFPFAKSAVQVATMDAAARAAGLPLHRFLGGKLRDRVELSYALSIDTPDAMARAASSMPKVACYKLKVSGDPRMDIARLEAVLKVRPDLDIWIDANQSYRPVHLETFCKAVENIPQVRCLEQPVKSVDWLGVRRARERTRIPMALDEGCFSSYDVARAARLDVCDLIVLKIAKSAGLWGCQRSAAVAQAHGLGLLGSGLTEAGIGLAASVHLYSTLELLLPPELNGPKFLADLFVGGLEIDGNIVTVPDAPGLGITVNEDAIRAHALPI
jgi:muconate cycloisomerase